MQKRLMAGFALALAPVLVAPLMAQGLTILPGEWELVMKSNIKTMPGMDAKTAAMIRQSMAKPMVIRDCLTADEIKRDPGAMMGKEAGCTTKNFRMSGGVLSADRVCKQDGTTTTSTMRGSYTPTSYKIAGAVNRSGGEGAMAMTMDLTGRRVSAVCSAKAK